MVVTNSQHRFLVRMQLETMHLQDEIEIFVEPLRRNTAPAIGLAIRYLEAQMGAQESDIVLVLPSDHLMEPEFIFLNALEQVEKVAREQWIITFGIRPTKPETGYGYIQLGAKYDGLTFETVRFVEKPDRTTAEQYVRDSYFYWNAGIFLFSIRTFWKQIKQHAPELSELLDGDFGTVSNRFQSLPDVSFDYAVMEKSKHVLMCPLPVSWSDVGSWDGVYDMMEKDHNQNVKVGHILDIDTKNSLIFGTNRLISTIGLEDMLIVETEDALFISKKGESQRVKHLVHELMRKGRKESIMHLVQTFAWGTSHLIDEGLGYCIKKICLFPNQTMIHSRKKGVDEEWILLNINSDFPMTNMEPEEWSISNPMNEIIVWLVIERCTISIPRGIQKLGI